MKKIILLTKIYLIVAILFSDGAKAFMEGFKESLHTADDEWVGVNDKANITRPYIFTYHVAQTSVTDSSYLITQISTNTENRKVDFYYVLGMTVSLIGLLLWILFLIKSFKLLNSIQKDFAFIKEIFDELKNIGFLLISGTLLISIGDYLYQLNDKRNFNIKGFRIIQNFSIDFNLLGIAIVILITAFIIKEGINLKEENDLTI